MFQYIEGAEFGIGRLNRKKEAGKQIRVNCKEFTSYDELMDHNSGTISISQVGDKKYDPEFIRRLIQKGMQPVEGWSYLKGMATISKYGFTIYPSSWVGSFGTPFSERNVLTLIERTDRIHEPEKATPYGWTVGLDLPTQATVDDAIEYLKNEMAS